MSDLEGNRFSMLQKPYRGGPSSVLDRSLPKQSKSWRGLRHSPNLTRHRVPELAGEIIRRHPAVRARLLRCDGALMPNFEMRISGPADELEKFSKLIAGSRFRVVARENTEIRVGHAKLQGVQDDNQAMQVGRNLLNGISAVSQIYLGSPLRLTIAGWRKVDEDGVEQFAALSNPFDWMVAAAGVDKIVEQRNSDGDSCLAVVADEALDDDEASLLLGIIGQKVPDWRDLYDIVELLGGPDRIATFASGAKGRVEAIKRTANYYRHLGNKTFTLPPNPPELREARAVVIRLAQIWLSHIRHVPGAPAADVVDAPTVYQDIQITGYGPKIKGGKSNG